MLDSNTGFLLLWAVVAAGLTWLFRSKAFVVIILLTPFIVASTFRHVAGMAELISFYGTSLIYGSPGIILGALYVDYQRTKAYFKRVSKTSFLARGGIGLSSIYILTYFSQQIIFSNPMVDFALGFIKGGDKAKELVSQADYNGVIKAGATIAVCFGVLAFNAYRENRRAAKQQFPNQPHLHQIHSEQNAQIKDLTSHEKP